MRGLYAAVKTFLHRAKSKSGDQFTRRIAVGPRQGSKVLTLKTLPACGEVFDIEAGKEVSVTNFFLR